MGYSRFLEHRPLPGRIPVSEAESLRFGIRVGRLEIGRVEGETPEAVRDRVLSSGLDLCVLRYPADLSDWLERLRHPALSLIHADTLRYYLRRLVSDAPAFPLPAGASIAAARPADAEEVRDVARRIFSGYRSHYAANPRLRAEDVADGYGEWAESCVRTADRRCLLARDAGSAPVGIVTFELSRPVEVGLFGVLDSARGAGFGTALLRSVEREARGAGIDEIAISTQAHNAGVQRLWTRLGYVPALSLETIHLEPRAGRPA